MFIAAPTRVMIAAIESRESDPPFVRANMRAVYMTIEQHRLVFGE